MPKWLMVKFIKVLLIVFRAGDGAVKIYHEKVRPVLWAGVIAVNVKMIYDWWHGGSIFEEVKVEDGKDGKNCQVKEKKEKYV